MTTWRVREPWLLLPPLAVAVSWVGWHGVDEALLVPLAVRML